MPQGDLDCIRCGECCKRLTVKITSSEIKRILGKGYRPEEFSRPDLALGGFELLRNQSGCVFLDSKKGSYLCRIYPERPKICRDYPSFGDVSCKPGEWTTRFKKGP
ncbi:YkgJ family cysteine cluster protein [Candidatus Woesearchaeota archaeon]|nr:YkgJ family cysteine cluster protein [Candidatus Woesearchaeota archaeon]